MDEDEPKSVHAEICDLDRLSSLPEPLICEILLKLPTKDVVRSSVLSSRWKNLWKFVPSLDLEYRDFPEAEENVFVDFIDKFLGFNSKSPLLNFKLKYVWDEGVDTDFAHLTRWINTVVKRKVQHLYVLDRVWYDDEAVELPPVMFTCETLVSLKLSGLTLVSPKFVLLPSLKVLKLTLTEFDDDLGVETLISGSPALERFDFGRSLNDRTQVIRVSSQSLLSFTYMGDGSELFDKDLVVEIDAPRLKYLRLSDARTAEFILNNTGSLVEADIDTEFNLCCERKFDPDNLTKRNMIRKFLAGISYVKDMTISTDTLEVVSAYSGCEPLPLFRNLYSLRVEFSDHLWEMLPVFLEKCLNIKSLLVFQELSTRYDDGWEGITNILSRPRAFLSSLEYVEIERPLKGETMELKLVSYLLENSRILKKLTVHLDDSLKRDESPIRRELLTIRRLSKSCRVVINSSSDDP